MKSRQSDKNTTFQVRLDRGWWEILMHLRITEQKSFRAIVEEALSSTYGIDESGKPYDIHSTKRKP